MFTDDAEYHADPFAPPMVGHNAIRAYWLDGSRTTGDVEFVPERHWVSGDTVLAAWHASYVETRHPRRGCTWSGFMTWELAPDGRIAKLREWTLQAPTRRRRG